MPTVWAHRGVHGRRGTAELPIESTIAAFRAAAASGADGVELDAQLLGDGGVAVHHDGVVDGGRHLRTLTRAELPAGTPLLADALDACGDLVVNVEVKVQRGEAVGPLLDAVLPVVAAWDGPVVLSSFSRRLVDAAGIAAPDLERAQLTHTPVRPRVALVRDIARRSVAGWHPGHAALSRSLVARAHGAGLVVRTWTIDDPARVRLLADWGVDAFITDDVPAVLAALDR